MPGVDSNETSTNMETKTQGSEDQTRGKSNSKAITAILSPELLLLIADFVGSQRNAECIADLHQTYNALDDLALVSRDMYKFVATIKSSRPVYRNPLSYPLITKSLSKGTQHIYLAYPPSDLTHMSDLITKLKTITTDTKPGDARLKLTLSPSFIEALLNEEEWEERAATRSISQHHSHPGDLIPSVGELLTQCNIHQVIMDQVELTINNRINLDKFRAVMEESIVQNNSNSPTHNVIFANSLQHGPALRLIFDPKEVTIVHTSEIGVHGLHFAKNLLLYPEVQTWNFVDMTGNELKPVIPIRDASGDVDNLDEHGNVGVLSGPRMTYREACKRKLLSKAQRAGCTRPKSVKIMDISEVGSIW